MAYNNGREDRKWRIWKEAEEKVLREHGVDETTIEQIRIDDRADFNSNRRFYHWTSDFGEYLEGMADKEQSSEIKTVTDLLDEIEDENLYQALLTVDRRTLQIVLLKMQGYSTKEIAPLVHLTTGAIYARLDHAFIKGASEKNEIEIIEPDKLNIAPCKGCGVCQCSKGCVDKDDTNPTIDKIAAADMILFATPVYWWGMSAQLKLIIDKCYCRGLQLKNKKVGTIVVGGSPVGSIQYELIDKQFDCMAKYLSWDMLFKKSYYATARDELEKNKDSMNELEGIGKNL